MSALEAIKACRREVTRCQWNLVAGGDPEFWRKRLTDAAKQYEAAAVILRMQIATLPAAPPCNPSLPWCSCGKCGPCPHEGEEQCFHGPGNPWRFKTKRCRTAYEATP